MDEGKKRKGQIVFTTATLAGQAYDAKGDMPQWALGRMRQMDMPDLVLNGFRKEDNDPNVKEEDKVVSIYDAHRIGEIWSEQLCTLAMMAIFKDRITHNVTEDFCLMITGRLKRTSSSTLTELIVLAKKLISATFGSRTTSLPPCTIHLE